MDTDDIKRAWADVEQVAREQIRAIPEYVATSQKAASALSGYRRVLIFELVTALVLAVAIGSYLGDVFNTMRYAVPAAVLQLFIVANVIAPAFQLVRALEIDLGGPVAEVQAQLIRLRRVRARETLVVLVCAPLLWTPLSIVIAHAWLGIDLYVLFGWNWVAWNLVFGLAVIVGAVWASRTFRDRISPGQLRSIADALAGHHLTEALRQSEAVSDFRRDD